MVPKFASASPGDLGMQTRRPHFKSTPSEDVGHHLTSSWPSGSVWCPQRFGDQCHHLWQVSSLTWKIFSFINPQNDVINRRSLYFSDLCTYVYDSNSETVSHWVAWLSLNSWFSYSSPSSAWITCLCHHIQPDFKIIFIKLLCSWG